MNIVINNIPDDPNTNNTDVVNAILKDENIVNLFRPGPPPGLGTNSDKNTPRPLIIRLSSPVDAQYWHRNSSGRKTEYEGSDIWINPDLTRVERSANYTARQERRKNERPLHQRPLLIKNTKPA